MNLERVTAVLRPRGPWEATDFGARLVRRDAAAVYRIWFAVTLPLLAVSAAVTWWSPVPALGALLYWWLEPIADAPILHLIARRLFGEATTPRDAIRAAPALALRNWIFLLSPYRFHFARSIAMPLTQLEGLRGKARRARAAVVNRRIFNFGFGVTAAYQHLFIALYAGVILLGYVFVPGEYQGTAGSSWLDLFISPEGGRVAELVGLVVIYVAQSALEPWFVGAGFGLYVNCRTDLEAWDLEVAFRRMVQRRAREVTRAAAVAVFVVAAALQTGVADAQTPAAEAPASEAPMRFESYWSEEELRPALDEVMASDELGAVRETKRWRSKNAVETTDRESPFLSIFAAIGRVFAFIFEIAVWLLVAAIVVWAAFMARKWLPALAPRAATRAPPPRIALADGEITAASLPADVAAAALERWRAGDARGALSLLYRGSVFFAVASYGVRLPASATEGMCLAAVEGQTDERHSRFFAEIVAAWTACAYGARLPAADVVPTLCEQWASHYEMRA